MSSTQNIRITHNEDTDTFVVEFEFRDRYTKIVDARLTPTSDVSRCDTISLEEDFSDCDYTIVKDSFTYDELAAVIDGELEARFG